MIQQQFCPLPEVKQTHKPALQGLRISLPYPQAFLRAEMGASSASQGFPDSNTSSAHTKAEVNIRVELANDFLFKVDTASMRRASRFVASSWTSGSVSPLTLVAA